MCCGHRRQHAHMYVPKVQRQQVLVRSKWIRGHGAPTWFDLWSWPIRSLEKALESNSNVEEGPCLAGKLLVSFVRWCLTPRRWTAGELRPLTGEGTRNPSGCWRQSLWTFFKRLREASLTWRRYEINHSDRLWVVKPLSWWWCRLIKLGDDHISSYI